MAKNEKWLPTIEDIKSGDFPPILDVEVDKNGWIIITFKGQQLQSGMVNAHQRQGIPMAPPRLKFRNWKPNDAQNTIRIAARAIA